MSLISSAKFLDEAELVEKLLDSAPYDSATAAVIREDAIRAVESARLDSSTKPLLDTFLTEYGLSNKEGVVLMCLAESLLRIPDQRTAERLIADKIQLGNWATHAGQADSLLVNASTWALMLTGRLVAADQDFTSRPESWFEQLASRMSEPVIEKAMRGAMQILGREFVLGTTIDRALNNSRQNHLYSYDMLGEAARDLSTANRYFESYKHAIQTIGQRSVFNPLGRPSVSIKLSALHPRFEVSQKHRVIAELVPIVQELCSQAAQEDIELTIDAEEADRTELTLEVFKHLSYEPSLKQFKNLGIVVQAYGKRALPILDWVIVLAYETGRIIPVRLVKGAYWDAEIKHAQVSGLPDFTVFTRKPSTDLSYLVCAKKIFAHPERMRGQLATHNAHTIAAVLKLANSDQDFEFQRLHGMGEAIYAAVKQIYPKPPVLRTYAPVGSHDDLLAYLVRRLLENGANSSFVNRFLDESMAAHNLVSDPVTTVRNTRSIRHPAIRRPSQLFADERINSKGVDLAAEETIERLCAASQEIKTQRFSASPLLVGYQPHGDTKPISNPANKLDNVGTYVVAKKEDIEQAFINACKAQPGWNDMGGAARAQLLDTLANMLEEHLGRFVAILCREAGKTFGDGISEVREAVDFCRYYAGQARQLIERPELLPSPTGETNELSLHGRGVFVCISPWNFPLAIFLGQVTAALAARNTVMAKPAVETPFVAFEAVRLMYQAGIPPAVCQFVLGDGDVGEALVEHPLTSGVAFTGSTSTAQRINLSIAKRCGSIIPLIAETGGQNVMIVDSTALVEQVTDDVITSAFHSAGQRCSALRVLYLQQDIADNAIKMIKGAMDELHIGDPSDPATDVGPIITSAAARSLQSHIEELTADGKLIHKTALADDCANGNFIAPCMFAIDSIADLDEEHFGPILHIVRFSEQELEEVMTDIEKSKYGLTLGVHSRIESRVLKIFSMAKFGNVYANRNMTGAVVGSQPFGGQQLSGTGPKAGGPNYLQRFCTEKVLTVNTVATGGNAVLLSLEN